MKPIEDYLFITDKIQLEQEGGVYLAATVDFRERLGKFLNGYLSAIEKEEKASLPFDLYTNFPNVDFPALKHEIFSRRQDLEILNKSFSFYLRPQKSVLEVGGWNGWLTSYLSRRRMDVITSDIFSDEINGLGCRKHYPSAEWVSLQMDLENVELFKPQFDVIVLNHCLHFYTHPFQLLEKYKKLLTKKGLLIVLGTPFFKNKLKKQALVAGYRDRFQKKHNMDLCFYPSKGFFDFDDYNSFMDNNFKFISYRYSIKGRIKKYLNGEKEGIMYFIA